MPELPEVETIRRDLEKEVIGRRVKTVEVKGKRSVRRHKSGAEFKGRLEGRKVSSIRRAGKYLLVGLDDDDILVVHLGMSGQLLRAKGPKDPMAPHTHVVITFTQGGQLRFVDPRTGIGNIYSDEILFAAGLRYDRGSDSLSAQEIRRLYRAMVETLSEAVKYRGSSLADEQYRDLFGETGDYQGQHQVYDREGSACRRCRNSIVRVKVNGRSAFLCEHCQI
jgi:formamidopyrimidine-DNA glycosylase